MIFSDHHALPVPRRLAAWPQNRRWMFFLALVLLPVTEVTGTDYAVVFSRPGQVGEKRTVVAQYTLQYSIAHENWVRIFPRPVRVDRELWVVVGGVLEILEIDKVGIPVRYSLAIDLLYWQDDMDELSELDDRKDRQIVVEQKGSELQIVKSNFKLWDYEKDILCRALNAVGRNVPSAHYGAGQRRRIGEVWPIPVDRSFVLPLLPPPMREENANVDIKKDAVTGTVTLVDRSDISGTDCLQLLAQVKGTNCVDRFGNSPLKLVNVAEEFRFLIPIDPDSHFSRSRRTRTSSFVVESIGDNEGNGKGLVGKSGFTEILETFVTPIDAE